MQEKPLLNKYTISQHFLVQKYTVIKKVIIFNRNYLHALLWFLVFL